MARPRTGEWVADEFAGLHAAGIRQIVSLLESYEELELGLEHEAEFASAAGMGFVSFPVPDRGVPVNAQDLAELTGRIRADIASGVSTAIHCRASLVAAAILLHDDLSAEAAFDTIRTARGLDVPDSDEQRVWLIENRETILARA